LVAAAGLQVGRGARRRVRIASRSHDPRLLHDGRQPT
jgi:hypothetical protein